jgi:signal transduction histidine kinase
MSLLDERILILASTQRDADSTFALLKANGLHSYRCTGYADLLKNISMGAGALLIAKEILVDSNLDQLRSHLANQPSWSDLPIVILASAGDLTQGKKQTVNVLKALPSATILERPVRIATLTTILETAVANRRRQYEVRDLVQKLIEARHEAEFAKNESDRANRAKSEFLANMSHEIRTPLGVILGFTELAMNEPDTSPEEKRSYLSAIHRNGQLLLALVNDILDLAKVEAGRIETEMVEVSIPSAIKEVIANLSPVAEKKNVEIHLQVAPDFDALGKTDPTRLRQIVMNVLGNAIKFTKKGRIDIQLSSQRTGTLTAKIFVRVRDTGMGISEQQQAKLFQPFSQADSSTTRQFGGTGLGLVLSRRLARALGGDLILISSIPEVGSTFEISIEVSVIPDRKVSRSTQLALPPTDLKGAHILLAEDSLEIQEIIQRILKMAGASVEVANNGAEAVEKALAKHYEILMMDIQMPVMDGKEALRLLRQNGYTRPIIAVTANSLKGEKEAALSLGFDDYMTKPLHQDTLVRTIASYL